MISYELAKKLKDAGCDQKVSEFYYRRGYHTSEAFDNGVSLGKKGEFSLNFRIEHNPYPRYRTADVKWNEADLAKLDQEEVAAPSLSELIEACGHEFNHLKKVHGDWKWEAYYNGEDVRDDNHYFFGNGSTPEEAVANLWLELNKK